MITASPIIFRSSTSHIPSLTTYLPNTKAAFFTVATTLNIPGCSIALNTTHAVVSALKSLQTTVPNLKAPRLIMLSSASPDAKFWRDMPSFVYSMLLSACSHIYRDLAKAEVYFTSKSTVLVMLGS
ncbi:hypothetical protein P153DRAFT_363300 [Dothidotthia symphoricarpi CBS 119687]|uniref:NAD(P)-binding protein n=1 Tax=Dothidotthia symphoricarpi CBS 119687 TaxID=1392245 RepID=A0A6A6AT20_9PLEO|nr:uncharacterized protein P153DRAFT_363300 [Dothidotthia symphoricarpi CBS 119687]KAF2134328.1 hypothetical protein P153DRAFT_363300 [Dothidotthia symphoricarpi CBS 119687]